MQAKKWQLEPDMEQQTGLKIAKGECQGCILSPAYLTYMHRASLVAHLVKKSSWNMGDLGLKDPVGKGVATYFSIVARRIPWTEEPGRLQSMGSQRVRHGWTSKHSTEYIMQNAGLDEAQAGIKTTGRNSNQICKWNHPYGRKQRGLKSLLMKVKEESEKADLKLNIQKSKIMASGPITSWQIDGYTVWKVTDFYFLGFKNHCRGWLQPWN